MNMLLWYIHASKSHAVTFLNTKKKKNDAHSNMAKFHIYNVEQRKPDTK